MFVDERTKPLANPGPLAIVDDVGQLDVKSPETFASMIAGVDSMMETSRELIFFKGPSSDQRNLYNNQTQGLEATKAGYAPSNSFAPCSPT